MKSLINTRLRALWTGTVDRLVCFGPFADAQTLQAWRMWA